MKTNQIPIGGRMKVTPDEVVLLEGAINYTKLYLLSGKQVIVATTLKKLEARFVILENFVRPHKSHIVNLNYLVDYQADNLEITMPNQKKIALSRRRKIAFNRKIKNLEN